MFKNLFGWSSTKILKLYKYKVSNNNNNNKLYIYIYGCLNMCILEI